MKACVVVFTYSRAVIVCLIVIAMKNEAITRRHYVQNETIKKRIVLFRDIRFNDSQSSDARFLDKLSEHDHIM